MSQVPKSRVVRQFPVLTESDFEITSCEDGDYNCIAWAASDSSHWWWPVGDPAGRYWPPDAPPESTVEAFRIAFESIGYEVCDDDALEDGFEKVALYAADNGRTPKHAARQLPSGRWASKLGPWIDIEHVAADSVRGPDNRYGQVVMFLRRPRTDDGVNGEDAPDVEDEHTATDATEADGSPPDDQAALDA